MQPKLIAAALTLALGLTHSGFSLAAGEAPTKKTGQPSAPESAENLLARTVFQSLLGELALQRGDIKLGVDAWADLAQRTRDPKILARATEVAGLARQYDKALELSRLWLEVEPDSAQARQAQTSLLAMANRIDDLAPQVASILAKDKANLAANLLQLNRTLAHFSDKKAAQNLVDRVAAPYENLPEAHFAMAQAAASANDNLRALTETEKALLLRPDWEAAALARAQLQARQSKLTAIDSLSSFVEQNPGARDARLALARLLINEKQYNESRKHFERLIKDNPDNPDVIYPVAMLALQHGDAATGRSQLEKLLTTDYPDKSTVHFFLGQLDQEQKNLATAIEHYLQVSTGDQYISARSRAAQILLQQGKQEEARELLHNTHSSNTTEQAQLVMAESQLLREAGNLQAAYAVLEAGLSSQPDNLELLYDAALTAERLGKPEILDIHLQHLLKLKPDHAHALNALGYSWAERSNRLPEAETLITKASKLMPDDPFIMDSLGWVLYRQGKLQEALKVLEKAYSIKADPEIAGHLGELLLAMERKDDARLLLQNAAEQFPDNAIINGALKKLSH
jgi:tetratricopeptide (TPR) repeat protein